MYEYDDNIMDLCKDAQKKKKHEKRRKYDSQWVRLQLLQSSKVPQRNTAKSKK